HRFPEAIITIRCRKKLGRSMLHTFCEEGKCPNLEEFMILDDTYTRCCRICNVKKSFALSPPDLLGAHECC
ncbi:hypothetical protein CICLE_v10023687mg, partial [Citrus x clementina]